MANNKRSGKGHGLRNTVYKTSGRIASNRRRRLERALKRNPENAQIKVALTGGLGQRRQTPKAEVWSHSDIRMAKLFKEVQGSFNMDILSRNEKLSAPALMSVGKLGKQVAEQRTRAQSKRVKGYDFGIMFSLGTRAVNPASAR